MALTWNQTMPQYGNIERVDINELRSNCDWLADNLSYCGTNYISNNANYGYYTTNCAANNSQCNTVNNSVNGSYTPCYSGGTCFPAGIKILLANKRWMSIEDIRPGDEVMSFYGNKNTIMDIYNTILGDRIMLGFPDGSLIFTPEESLWAKNEMDEYWAISDYNKFLKEENFNYLVNGVSYYRGGLNRKSPILQIDTLDYAHLAGWNRCSPVPRRDFGEKTIVYNLIPDGDFTYFVNGYITYGAVNDDDIDYTKYKWNGLKETIPGVFYLSNSMMTRRI